MFLLLFFNKLNRFIKYNLFFFSLGYLHCIVRGVRFAGFPKLFGFPFIETYSHRGEILIGKNFVARSTIDSNTIGVFQKVILKTEPGARLIIGNNVGISGSTISSSMQIVINDNVLIGSGCLITDSDSHPMDPVLRHTIGSGFIGTKPIIIEGNVFLGARTIVLKGVKIGENSVVGAGSVVTKDIPPNCVAAGNPARVIKMFS